MGALPARTDVEQLLAEAGWVRGLAARLLGEAGDPEDLVQDTWVAALEAGGPVHERRGPAGLRAWVAAVVRNLALRRRRQTATRRHHELRAASEHEAGAPGDALERVETHRRLAEELLALEEPLRTAVILRHLDGLRYRAIARRQGVSEAAARQRVSRGLARLRARLERRFEGEGGALRALVGVAWKAPWIRGGLWTGGAIVGAKGIAAGVAAAGAVALVVWSTRGGREEMVPAGSVQGSDLAAAPDARAATPGRPTEEPTPVVDGKDKGAPAARRTVAVPVATDVAFGDLLVTDRDGRALAGAWVRRADAAAEEDAAVAGEDGRVRVPLDREAEALAAGRLALDLQVGCDGYLARSVVLASLDPLEVVLRALPRVHGLLLDPAGRPVTTRGSVRLGVLANEGADLVVLRAQPDAGGTYRVDSVPLGRMRWISAMAEGFVETRREMDLALELDRDEELDVTLAAGSVVEGVVLDATTDEPLPDAFVWTDDFFWDEGDLGPTATTDARGRFRLEGVRVGRQGGTDGADLATMLVFARTETHAAKNEWSIVPWREDGHYEIVLRIEATACAVTGVLREAESGEPAPGVGILAVDVSEKTTFAMTDGEGRFRFEGLPPGPLELFGRQGALDRCRTVAAHLELEPGATEDLELELLGSDRSCIRGRLVDSRGASLAGSKVECSLLFRLGDHTIGPFDTLVASADATGRFAFAHLPPGRYRLRPAGAVEEAADPAVQELVLAQDEVSEGWDFVVGASATFAGTLASGSGSLAGLRVRLVDEATGAELENARPDGEGRFLFRPVLAGRYAIQVLRGEKVLLDLPVGPGGDTDLPLFVP